MKRLRKHIHEKYNKKTIKFFHCGEYGEESLRPHYHAIIFNHNFSDRFLFSDRGPEPLYTSPILDQLWGKGITSVGDFSFKSAAYVARYITKKITGELAHEHYKRFDTYTGEITFVQPEYATNSQYLGKGWYDKFKTDVYPSDEVIINGHKQVPPKYFDKLYEQENPNDFALLKKKRITRINKFENSYERLEVRKIVKQAQLNQLKRPL
jgi:hypothetical protein